MTKVFNIACAIFLATAFFIVVSRFLDTDNSSKPSISLLQSALAEISLPCVAREGPQRTTSKHPLIGVSKTYYCFASKEEVERAFDASAKKVRWALKEKKVRSDDTRLIYCRGRIALDVAIISHGGRTAVDFGTYWTSDKGSFRYCPSRESDF